ncbi:MAG: hypothetical protein GY862_20880 [Gammaproteobacteria bacterium]|nr:hypothetical protein [Gammaproteobacteria bacterium]
MNFSHTLSTAPLEHPAMDYGFLRREGIRHLERLAGQLWTDFNAHDPGITILEQVCYALTDLAHRINYPLPDLLSSHGAKPYDSLYGPAQILPSYPVTIDDLRKLIIDVEGVKNAWIEKVEGQEIPLYFDAGEKSLSLQGDTKTAEPVYLKGLYRVLLEISDLQYTDSTEDRDAAVKQVARRLHAHRGLGENFETIQRLEPQEIQIHARIEIDALDDADSVLLEIYQRIADYISPTIRFSSLSELLQAGKGVDEIFEGPLLEHGFIDSDDLKRAQRRTALRTSDLIHEIMDVQGVKAVRQISISAGGAKEAWSLDLDPNKAPRLNLSASNISLERNQLAASIHVASVIEAYYQRLRQSEAASKPVPLDLQAPSGRDRNVENYYSIQHQFPAAYGIGAMGLPDSAPPLRKAQAKQLQAYLLFFDQLLANCFSQLAHVNDLFSFTEASAQTYFSQAITDPASGIEDIRQTDLAAHKDRLQQISENPDAAAEGDQADFRRRNRFLNHLLARFAEQFTDYSLIIDDAASEEDLPATEKLVRDKQAFLRDYPQLSQARGTACLDPWGNTDDSAGLENRLQRKLGIAGEAERFYIVEHILLGPMEEDRQQQMPLLAEPRLKDPYSLQISFVFPKLPSRFNKAFIERTVREETPAHLSFFTLDLLEESDMEAFASAYHNWLNKWSDYQRKKLEMQKVDATTQIQLRHARDRLIDLLGLGQTYPLQDLAVSEQLTVAISTPAKIHIENSQPGVLYQLHDRQALVTQTPDGEQGAGAPIQTQGTGEEIILKTYKIEEDVVFEILAKKEQSGREIYLHKTATVKVGLDVALTASIQNAPYLDPAIEKPAVTAPRIVDYGASVTVEIQNSQEGVDYQLVCFTPAEEVLSAANVRGTLHNIILTIQSINEDTDIRIRAVKTFDESERATQTALLNTVLPLKVRANPALSVSAASAIIDYEASATLKIANTQTSSAYQLYIRPIPDRDFVRQAAADAEVIKVSVSGEPDVQIPKPDWNLVWETPQGYTALGAPQTGSGGEIELALGPLTHDHLVIIQAQKEHQADQTVSSAVQLEQAAAVLVRPNPNQALSIKAAETGTNSGLQVSGGQPGVFYYFRLAPEGEDLGLPAYFHKRDAQDDTLYKGLNQLNIQVDYVITGLSGALESPIVVTDPLPDNTALYVHAMKAQTRAATPFTHTVQPE